MLIRYKIYYCSLTVRSWISSIFSSCPYASWSVPRPTMRRCLIWHAGISSSFSYLFWLQMPMNVSCKLMYSHMKCKVALNAHTISPLTKRTNSPQLLMVASCKGREFRSTGSCSNWRTKSWPDTTWPKTTCTLQVQKKNQLKWVICRTGHSYRTASPLTCRDVVQVAWYYNEKKTKNKNKFVMWIRTRDNGVIVMRGMRVVSYSALSLSGSVSTRECGCCNAACCSTDVWRVCRRKCAKRAVKWHHAGFYPNQTCVSSVRQLRKQNAQDSTEKTMCSNRSI